MQLFGRWPGQPKQLKPVVVGNERETNDLSKKRNLKMKTYQRFVTALVVGTLLGVTAIGCNTFRGAGKDIQQGGRSVENAAEGAQK